MARANSGTGAAVALLFAVIGIIGWAAFEWEFTNAGVVPSGVGAVVAVVAVAATAYRRVLAPPRRIRRRPS
jgi:CHASE2 domain-containing sensor protein